MNEALSRLRERISITAGKTYLIGLSGGADSVCLMMMLLPEIRKGIIRAEAIHVNHGLRGEESDADQRFVECLCAREGIKCHTRRPDLSGRKDENSARAARYECFREIMKESGADALMLAHHADDQAETFLMRLLRGAGADGLQAMAEKQSPDDMTVIRPMLNISREEIREALRQDNIPWREDSSNLDETYLRNRIRLELIPVIERVYPGGTGRIRNASKLIREDNEALLSQARVLYEASAGDHLLRTDQLERAPKALKSRVLRIWWHENAPKLKERELSLTVTEQLLELMKQTSGKMNLPAGLHAERSPGFLHLTGDSDTLPEPVVVSGKETCFGAYRLTEEPSAGNPGNGKREQEVPAGFATGCLIRTRRPGDRIRPFGSTGSRKLQDYLTDRKIAEPFRDRIPLLCRENEVLLVCGVGAGRIPEWHSDQNHVRLIWHGDIPWMK